MSHLPHAVVRGEKERGAMFSRRRLMQGAATGALVMGGGRGANQAFASQEEPRPGRVPQVAISTDSVGLDPMIAATYSTALVTDPGSPSTTGAATLGRRASWTK